MKAFPLLLLLWFPGFGFSEMVTGLNLSTPLLLTGSVGFTLGGGDPTKEPMPMIEFEGGYGGGRILVGLDGTGRSLGWGVKAALLKTWFEPIDLDENQMYLGAEFQANAGKLIGSLGAYTNIDGDDDSFITTLLIGLRF